MIRNSAMAFLAFATLGLAGCGGVDEPAATVSAADKTIDKTQAADSSREEGFARIPATPASPFQFDYKLIGTPIVGSPVSFDLHVKSMLGDAPIDIGYQAVDSAALALPDAQPRRFTAAPLAGEEFVRERVTVIPQREGRMYFNVSASVMTSDGTTSTVISIPLHVGDVDTGLVEHGELQTDAEGNTTRVLRRDE